MVSFSLLFIVSCLALLWGSTEATCTCRDVCPSYDDVWKVSSNCPAEGLQKCTKPHIVLPTCHSWGKADEGGCVCNFFGCKCEGCGCRNNRRLGSPPLASAPKEDTCDDYNFYMRMSEEERNLYLIEKHCGSSVGSPTQDVGLRMFLEDMADSNGDGSLDCPEFNSAYSSLDVSLLCRGSQ